MGNSQSSTIRQCMEIINKNMLTVVNERSSSSGAFQVNKNSIVINVSGKADCDIILNQSIQATQGLKVSNKFESTNDLQQVLEQTMNASLKQDQKAVNDFLSLGFNKQTTKTELEVEIKNVIDTQVRNTDITSCNAIIDNLNEGKINIDGDLYCKNKLQIDQSIIAAQQAQCASETAFSVLMRSKLISEAVSNIESKQVAENKGITDFLKGLIVPLIIIGVIIVLVIIAKNVFTKNPQTYMGGGYGGGYGGPGMSVNMRT